MVSLACTDTDTNKNRKRGIGESQNSCKKLRLDLGTVRKVESFRNVSGLFEKGLIIVENLQPLSANNF
jgi:hypothetical protein